MSQDLKTETIATDLAELKKLFGPPAVLSTENVDSYYAIMARFVECFKPGDFMMQMFMKDLTDRPTTICSASARIQSALKQTEIIFQDEDAGGGIGVRIAKKP